MSTLEIPALTIYNIESDRPFIRVGAKKGCCGAGFISTSGEAFNLNQVKEILDIYKETKSREIKWANSYSGVEVKHFSKKDISEMEAFVTLMELIYKEGK